MIGYGDDEDPVSEVPWLGDEPIVVYFHNYRHPLDVVLARASKTVAFGIVLAAHLALLTAWRPAKLATSEAAIGDPGAGGIMVSLVSGRLGMPAVQTISETGIGAEVSGPSTGEPASGLAAEGATGVQAAGVSSAAGAPPTASKGGLADDDGVASAANVGVGYDPWAQASLAPRFLKVRSEPGLWEQVTRCWHGDRPDGDLAVTVVLGEGGAFMGAYPQAASGLAVSASTDGETFARAVDALRSCAPYHDVPTSLASRLTLVVPASGS